MKRITVKCPSDFENLVELLVCANQLGWTIRRVKGKKSKFSVEFPDGWTIYQRSKGFRQIFDPENNPRAAVYYDLTIQFYTRYYLQQEACEEGLFAFFFDRKTQKKVEISWKFNLYDLEQRDYGVIVNDERDELFSDWHRLIIWAMKQSFAVHFPNWERPGAYWDED